MPDLLCNRALVFRMFLFLHSTIRIITATAAHHTLTAFSFHFILTIIHFWHRLHSALFTRLICVQYMETEVVRSRYTLCAHANIQIVLF